eukprot:593341_1
MSHLVIIFLWYTSTLKLSSANFNCISRTSGKSGGDDGDTTYTRCTSSPYLTLVSCGFRSYNGAYARVDGAYVSGDRCYAINGRRDGYDGQGVYAVARCCDFSHIPDVSCVALDMGAYATGDDGKKSITCGTSSHQFLTGCTAHGPWSTIEGCYPGTADVYRTTLLYNSDYDFNGYCTAVNGASGGGTKGHLMCCDSPSYALQCVIRYGAESGSDKDSRVTCGAGYEMTSCSGFGNWMSVNAWYITGDTCVARTWKSSSNVYAIAICCKFETDAPTPAPTPSPTPKPSPNPTRRPTPLPTTPPTTMPTSQPTVDPTINPTVHPTVQPTVNPSINPTVNPTTDPTVDPTNAPSMSPTIAPSGSPTSPPTLAPTPVCPNLKVIIIDQGTLPFNKDKFEGLYVYEHQHLINDRPVFEIPQMKDDKNIQYHGVHPTGSWIIEGESDGELSFGPTDLYYPPHGAQSYNWTHSNYSMGLFDVVILCVQTFAPVAAPTSSPTVPPTHAPTFAPTLAPSHSPSVAPSNAPSIAPTQTPSTPPTNSPSDVPSNAPSAAPTVSPTSMCHTLTVRVLELNGVTLSTSAWDGMYRLDVAGGKSFGLDDWIGYDAANGAWIKYIGSHWILSGTNLETMSYHEVNDADNYPPIGTTTWTHFISSRTAALVEIQCSSTFSPTPAPTASPSGAPTVAPTKNYVGVFVNDTSSTNNVYNHWLYLNTSHARFVYNGDTHFSELLYDAQNGWQIETREGTNANRVYYSGRHGLNPPLNEWVYFNLSSPSTGTDLRLFITGLLTWWPTNAPSKSPLQTTETIPSIAPVVPSTSPTAAPSVSPTVVPSHAPTSYPTTICDALRVTVPQGFGDTVAAQIFSSVFVHRGAMYNHYPYWSIGSVSSGYAGSVYFNGDDAWTISIHSSTDDYYKLYSTVSQRYLVPLSAEWTDADTPQGISQARYVFMMECDVGVSSEAPVATAEEKDVVTEYVYVRPWFWVTVVLIVLFVSVCCIFVWIFCRKVRKKQPSVVHFDGNPRAVELNASKGENDKPGHKLVVTDSGVGNYTCPSPSIPDIPPEIEEEEDGDGQQTTTGDVEWDEDPDKIFKV